MTATTAVSSTQPPLYVDLDGTLIHSDVLWESLLRLVRQHPLKALTAVRWLPGGKAHFKTRVTDVVAPAPDELPYNADVLEFLQQQRATGRRLVLATATDERVARRIAEHLELFDDVLATTSERNLSGSTKLQAIETDCNGGEFDYIADGAVDLPVLKAARHALLANPRPAVLKSAEAAGNVHRVFVSRTSRMMAMVKAMRPHQWAKNVLLAVPLVMAHQVLDISSIAAVIVAMMSFSVVASSVYIINDLLDLAADRRHAHKCRRPFAAGHLSIPTGLVMAATLLVLGVAAAALLLPWNFLWVLLVYLAATTAYSLDLKRRLLVDVIVLAGLYTLRILAGGAAVDVTVSQWLLAFSMFLFMSLAFVKRYTEAADSGESAADDAVAGRSYRRSDSEIIRVVGPTHGYLAVLVLAMYINSPDVQVLYGRPDILWLLCPILIYWVSRIWFLAHRGELHHDPVVFALLDRRSQVAGVLTVAVLLAAVFM